VTGGHRSETALGESPTVQSIGDDVYLIDTLMGGFAGINAAYLVLGSRPTLIETGTAVTSPVVDHALRFLGLSAADLQAVVVTHIHLDHAGAVGDLTTSFPGAQVYVHERGARHLVDPTRLMAGSRAVYGDRTIDAVFGCLTPTSQDRVHALADGKHVDLGGGRYLRASYTPGHAKHHLSLLDSASGDIYVGDAAGIFIPETGQLKPASPPADFNLHDALDSLRRLEGFKPTRLLFTHFGPCSINAEATLKQAAEELRYWVEIVKASHDAAEPVDHAVGMVTEATLQRYADTLARHEVANKFEFLMPTATNVEGIYHWLDSPSID
jgi:glyoxylase-like metal-dependent hydrolase (beta-lactamase superfamily II)